MKNWYYVFGVIAIALIGFGMLVRAGVEITDNTNVPVPADNGTASQVNVTSRMQQYVGFYGNVSVEVRKNSSVGSGTMYSKVANRGKLYFFKNGATPTAPFFAAPTNTYTDGNLSVSFFYQTSNHFTLSGTICGVNSVNHLNTTDNFAVGIFYDSAAAPNYFFCTDIRPVSSTNNFGDVDFELIAVKTASFMNYDIWQDLT